jgi:hypothetical protein
MDLQRPLPESVRRIHCAGYHVEPVRFGFSLQQFASASSLDVVTRRRHQHQNRLHPYRHYRQDHRCQLRMQTWLDVSFCLCSVCRRVSWTLLLVLHRTGLQAQQPMQSTAKINFLVDPLPLIWELPAPVVAKQARQGSITFRRYDDNLLNSPHCRCSAPPEGRRELFEGPSIATG